MADVVPLPSDAPRTVLADARGTDRALRVTWHDHGAEGLVVFSIWREDRCTATFRLTAADVPQLVDTLVRGLAPAPDAGPDTRSAVTRIVPLPSGDPAS